MEIRGENELPFHGFFVFGKALAVSRLFSVKSSRRAERGIAVQDGEGNQGETRVVDPAPVTKRNNASTSDATSKSAFET
jgi:hypothetical protein